MLLRACNLLTVGVTNSLIEREETGIGCFETVEFWKEDGELVLY